MPDFAYIARALSGQQVTGVLTANSRHEALTALAAQELFPVQLEPARVSAGSSLSFKSRVSKPQLAVFYAQLADLLQAGVPLLRALELLEKQSRSPGLSRVVQQVREQVAEGTRLADAMRQHTQVFGELAVSMVRAGEEGAFLEDVLKRIAAFTEHQQELRSRVVGAAVYPIFLLIAMTVVVVCMLVFFVPKFDPIFDRLSQHGQLPWATTVLMAMSAGVQNYWGLGLLALAGISFAGYRFLASEQGRLRLDRFRLWAPVLGPMVRSLAISRFSRILGTLLNNGVPLLPSLRIAQDATGNKVLSQAISVAAEQVSEGKSLAGPLRSSGEFPDEVLEMISVGEEANNLEQVLIDVADSMERRTRRFLDMLVRLLEPVLLSVMAGVVLFVVVALLWPILQSSSLM